MASDRQRDPRLRTTPLAGFTAGDVAALRLLLEGGSIVDWPRLWLTTHAEVDRMLRINELDPASQRDLDRLEAVRQEAVDYLRRNLHVVPDELADGVSVRDLLIIASTPEHPLQVAACMVFKVMHVLHHLAGRELLFKLPVSEEEIFHLVEDKVVRAVERMRAAGAPVVEFAWSRKRRDALITKLLAKRETIAANIHDKLRFRLLARRFEDIAPVLREMMQRLVPFQYVVPGETVNGLLELVGDGEEGPAYVRPASGRTLNEFSGPGYRVVNFVVDMPVRIDAFLTHARTALYEQYGSIVFVLTEFQVADVATAESNERGENSHARYKARQLARVRARLASGRDVRGIPVMDSGDPEDDLD